jgi:hypothetical protein
MLYELISVFKVVFYALILITILVVMTLSLLSILNEDMIFTSEVIEFKKGRFFGIIKKLVFCGIAFVCYYIMMVLIR